jgi:hypothetical protein
MPKVIVFNVMPSEEDSKAQAEKVFSMVLDLTDQHGVCFLRFTKSDGMVIIEPRYNARINGVIADA